MSFPGGNYFAAESNNMASLECLVCNHIFCQCGTVNNNFSPDGASEGASMAPSYHQRSAPPRPFSPSQQDQHGFAALLLRSAGAFPHYNGAEQPQFCSHYGNRVVDSDAIEIFAEGPYAYGQNNEGKSRGAERLAVLNDPHIESDTAQPMPREAVVHDHDDLLHDGTVNPTELALPVMKVPCPECGNLLKDEKSVSRHLARQHNPNVAYFYCQAPNCSYNTPKRADLVRHTRSRHPVDLDPKPYKCHVCAVGFSRKDNLRRHIVTCTRNHFF